jgi:putative membrane protein
MATLVDKYFSTIDLKAIEDAVRTAEASTSGELAVTVASRSRHWIWERVEAASIVAVLAMVVSLFLTRQTDWGTYYNFTQALLWGLVGFIVAYFAAKPILMRPERTRRVVWNHALEHFKKLTPTKGQTGVLIFVSLEENQAAVIADTGIASKLPENHWHTPHGMIIDAMKKGKHAEGIIAAVGAIGVELARYFPRLPDDENELPDRVTIDKG